MFSVEYVGQRIKIDFISTVPNENAGLAKALVRQLVKLVGAGATIITSPVIDKDTNRVLAGYVYGRELPVTITNKKQIDGLKIARVLNGGGISVNAVYIVASDDPEDEEGFSAIFVGST